MTIINIIGPPRARIIAKPPTWESTKWVTFIYCTHRPTVAQARNVLRGHPDWLPFQGGHSNVNEWYRSGHLFAFFAANCAGRHGFQRDDYCGTVIILPAKGGGLTHSAVGFDHLGDLP